MNRWINVMKGSVVSVSLLLATPAAAQVASPAYELLCEDCSGNEVFGDDESADGCQSYTANRFEAWTDESGSKLNLAAQTDIVEVDETSDADFWYYRITTRAANWNTLELGSAQFELAFGDCTNSDTRFELPGLAGMDERRGASDGLRGWRS